MTTTTTPQVGKTYCITHSRKGKFTGRVMGVSGEWATVQITDGKAGAVLHCNERNTGETVTVRIGFCSFAEPS